VDVSQFTRRDDLALLIPDGGICAELGVAEGRFSEKLLQRSRLGFLYSIDMWSGDRGHDVAEYRRALERLLPHRGRNTALRMTFEEALPLFPDAMFDFIYVDGYAHTGAEGGKTHHDWYPKVKPGGIIAGDDYAADFPLVVEAVDRFVATHGLTLNVLHCTEKADDWMSQYDSWFAFAPR
jgi:hypothetical protein